MDEDQTAAGAARAGGDLVVQLTQISKYFGPTVANFEIDLDVRPGEIVGLVGGNGAGKSTLMKILCGGLWPTLGSMTFGSQKIAFSEYDTAEAHALGIRMVHQELSLCTNLTVAENFFLEAPNIGALRPGWRRPYKERARASLDEIFPGNDIDGDAPVGKLSIGERQMVEIARACASPNVKLVVLDEPTSSLSLERSLQLREFVQERSATGISFIFISHKLQEVVEVAQRVDVMRNGRIVWRGQAADASIPMLVHMMGGEATTARGRAVEEEADSAAISVRIGGRVIEKLDGPVELRRGEIVGLAGLEGGGQKELLLAIFDAARSRGGDIECLEEVAFVAGDREKEGLFPLWDVLRNITIGYLRNWSSLGIVRRTVETDVSAGPAERLSLDQNRFDANILHLSGGNQQKALVARALAAQAPIILLDDPTRGVDVITKNDFYQICVELAKSGATIIWRTTEDAELLVAHRVLVFGKRRIVHELRGEDISEKAIVSASFSSVGQEGDRTAARQSRPATALTNLVDAAPYVGLLLMVSIMVWANPAIASVFGIDLLMLPAISLVLVTMAQMFIVGGSEIDLSIGAFAGLVSVISATLLVANPLLGSLGLLAALVLYSGLGGFIQARRVPAIVVTLGASFVWLGVGYSLQPTPGGESPAWLTATISWSLFGLPTSLILIAIVAAVAWGIDRLPLGVALRGFGNNPDAMVRSGWPRVRYGVYRYFVAGLFGAAAGLSLTAINTASDVNAGNSFTILSVASVVMGGCALFGGLISPLGAVVGAMSLSLIGAMLGALNISSDFNVAAQGLVLILLLTIRSLSAFSRGEELS